MKVDANPQLGYDSDVLQLKRTLADIFRENAQAVNTLLDGYTITSVTAATHTDITTQGHALILCDCTANNITVNLPTAAGNKAIFNIKKMDAGANTVTIDANGSETIDGAATKVITAQYATFTLLSSGTNWVIV
jgi:hypothetical protein